MLLDEIKQRWGAKYTKFKIRNDEYAIVSISDKSEIREDSALIRVEIQELINNSGGAINDVPIGTIPIKQSGGMVRLGNTYYNLMNGLIQQDGFYLTSNKNKYSLQFIQHDKLLFNIESDKGKISVAGSKKKGKSSGLRKGMPADVKNLLIGLGVFNSADEYDYYMADVKHYFTTTDTQVGSEELSRMIFVSLYGPTRSDNFSELLHKKTFEGFFGAGKEYINKHIFFSYSRFIGNKLVSCPDDRIPSNIIIDEEIALMMDRFEVPNAVITFNSDVEETINVNWGTDFTVEDLLNAIRLLVLKTKYGKLVADCDLYALYNKAIYNYYDYVTDYIYDRVSRYLSTAKSVSMFSGMPLDHTMDTDFRKWASTTASNNISLEKGLSIPSANNQLTFYMNRFKFTKDLFRDNLDSINDNDRYLHPSYFGWINPFITSDSAKAGLTGSFVEEVDVSTLTRPFITLNNYMSEDKQEENEDDRLSEEQMQIPVHFTPSQTFNKIIGFIEKDGSFTTMLNGKIMQDWSKNKWDIYNHVSSLEDRVTDIVPGLECDQAKRYRLSNKAIIQSLPMICGEMNPRKGVKVPWEDSLVGKTALEIVTDLAEIDHTVEALLKQKGPSAALSLRIISAVVGRYNRNNSLTGYDDNQDDTYHITMSVGGFDYVYRHPRYIQSPSESTRLYFNIRKPTNGTYFLPDEVVISAGKIGEIGQECNVMYGCLEGYTFEDGYILTTNFLKRMGLSTKLHFSETVQFEGELSDIKRAIKDPSYLDIKGLPKIGSFIRKGDVLCKLDTAEVKYSYSKFTGFVEGIKINSSPYRESKKEVKIYLCDISVPTVGDKIGNGHGNKGVAVKIIPSELLCVSGQRQPDIIINPLGTIARMNFGQITEMLSNLISELTPGERVSLEAIGANQKDIKTLVKEMQNNGMYEEQSVIYKGELLQEKVFVAPMVMYRMKQHSRIHLKYVSTPELNVNHLVAEGQRMSVLNMVLYSAYGCQDVLQYMFTNQSRVISHAKNAENRLIAGDHGEPDKNYDYSILRANAMHMSYGCKLTNQGPAILTSDDVDKLEVLSNNQGILGNKKIFGTPNPSSHKGYNLVAKINLGNKIIMPAILDEIGRVIPYKVMYEGKSTTSTLSPGFISTFCLSPNAKMFVKVDPSKSHLWFIKEQPNGIDLVAEGFSQGYFALVRAINQLDMWKVRELLDEDQQTLFDTFVKVLGTDFIKKVTLDGVPVAPINLRPQYKGRSGQSVDSLYNALSNATSAESAYNILCNIKKEFTKQLYQHSASVTKKGEIAHGEKTSEYIDSLYARRLGYSGRSVATFDSTLEIYELSLPLELLFYEIEPVVKAVAFDYVKEDYSAGYPTIAAAKVAFDEAVDDMMRGYISSTTYDKELLKLIEAALEDICRNIASGMTREPVLRRQNHFWYRIKFHHGHSIKVHPAVCSGYNLDFDGDAVSNFISLSKHYAFKMLDSASPYQGIYDADSGEIWIKPVQDSLLGLYKLTKFSPQEEVTKIYVDHNGDTLKTLKTHVATGVVNYSDTVIFMKTPTQFLKQTVGNLILLLTIRDDALIEYPEYIEGLLGTIVGGMTSKTNSKFIEKLLGCSKLYDDDEFWSNFGYDLAYFEKFRPLHIIRKVVSLGYEIVTHVGVTLKPSMFAEIRTAEEINRELGITTHEFTSTSMRDSLCSKTPPLFTLSTIRKSKKDVQDLICNSIYANAELSDIFRSGCRGKIEDFLKVCDSIGNNIYEGNTRYIKSNYSKGLSYIDKMLLAQPDRKAVVNTQVHLGEQGAKLKQSAIVSSSIKIKEDRCNGRPMDFFIEYDVFINGHNITDREYVKVTDEYLVDEINSIIEPIKKHEGEYPSGLVSKLLQKHECSTLNGEPLTYKIKSVDNKIISSHYIVYKNTEYAGNTIIPILEESHPRSIKIFTLYNCTVENGVCSHCYGLPKNPELVDSFKGNIGINVVFSVGQQAFQDTLDASKSTSGDIGAQNQSMLTLFQRGVIDRFARVPENSDIEIEYSGDHFVVSKADNERIRTKCTPNEFDIYYKEHDAFLPKKFINFEPLMGHVSPAALEYLYANTLRLLCSNITPQQADTLLAVNTRFVWDGVIKPITPENMDYPRRWLCENELYKMQDPLISALLPDAREKFIKDAVQGRKYSKDGLLSGIFSFEEIETIQSKTSVLKRKFHPLRKTETQATLLPEEDILKINSQKQELPNTRQQMAILDVQYEELPEEIPALKFDLTNEF